MTSSRPCSPRGRRCQLRSGQPAGGGGLDARLVGVLPAERDPAGQPGVDVQRAGATSPAGPASTGRWRRARRRWCSTRSAPPCSCCAAPASRCSPCGAAPPRLAALCFLIVAAFLLVNKVWSPQYSLWLVPLAVLALPRWRVLLTWMLVDALLAATGVRLPGHRRQGPADGLLPRRGGDPGRGRGGAVRAGRAVGAAPGRPTRSGRPGWTTRTGRVPVAAGRPATPRPPACRQTRSGVIGPSAGAPYAVGCACGYARCARGVLAAALGAALLAGALYARYGSGYLDRLASPDLDRMPTSRRSGSRPGRSGTASTSTTPTPTWST